MGNARQRQRQREERLKEVCEALGPGDPLRVSLVPLVASHLPHVKRLHKARLPVAYSDGYFEEALQSVWCKAALHEGARVALKSRI